MSQPSGTNCPKDFLRRGPFSHPGSSNTVRYLSQELYDIRFKNLRDLGGYSNGVPPLPIPNREVKPINADGTAVTCGRVGSRHFKERFARVAPFFVVFGGYVLSVSFVAASESSRQVAPGCLGDSLPKNSVHLLYFICRLLWRMRTV